MKLLDNEMVELTAEDLRHTLSGMPCCTEKGDRYFDDEFIRVKHGSDFITTDFCEIKSITARLRDWQVYTARRVFEMNPVANYITPGRWWKTQPAYHDGQWYPGEYGEEMDPDNWGVNGPVNIPDIWAGTPDDQAISREEVEDDEK